MTAVRRGTIAAHHDDQVVRDLARLLVRHVWSPQRCLVFIEAYVRAAGPQ